MAKDFIYVALMFDFKFVLSECFLGGRKTYDEETNEYKPITLGEAVKEVSNQLSHGIYTNDVIIEIQ